MATPVTPPAPAGLSAPVGPAGPAVARVVRAADDQLRPLYPVARLIKGAVLEAEQERAKAKALLQQAMTEAQRIVDEANTQAQEIVEKARREGRQDGYAQFRSLIESAAADVDAMSQKFSGEVKNVAVRIAREVLHAELATNPQRIVDIVRAAVEDIRNRLPQRIIVHLHPDDYTAAIAARDELADGVPPDTQFSLMKDTSLEPHQVVLETEMGHYDFSIESQLAEIRRVLRA